MRGAPARTESDLADRLTGEDAVQCCELLALARVQFIA
jgi:hypothetical protein